MTIAPDQARQLLYEGHTVKTPKVKDGKDGGNWQAQYKDSYWNQFTNAPYEDAALYAAAPDLAQTVIDQANRIEELEEQLAGVQWGHGVGQEYSPGNWHLATEWSTEANPYQPGCGPGDDERIVRRLVGPVEVVDE